MLKREYFLFIVITLVILVFSNIYVFYGLFSPKEGLTYLGRRVINSQDTYTYVAFIEQAKQGKILFENLYTTEPQTASLIRPSYYFLGRIASVLDISSIAAYHLGRIIFSIVFCLVLYLFLGIFFKSYKRRLLAYTIIISTTGLGFLVGSLWSQVSDAWIPESNTFLSLQEAPHFILSQMFMLLTFLFVLKGWGIADEKNRTKRRNLYLGLSFVSLFLLTFEHPYDLLLCTGAIFSSALYLALFHKVKRSVLVISALGEVVVCFLGLLYQYTETVRNPILSNWAAQSKSPNPMDYILGYGILIPFAVIGLERYLTQRKVSQILIISWVGVTSILLYSPVFFQRRLSEGFHIPLGILGTEGLIITAFFVSRLFIPKVRKMVSYMFVSVVVFVMCIGTVLGVQQDVGIVSKDSMGAYYYYMLSDEIKAMEYLKYKTDGKDIILSNWFYGNVIPGVTGRKVYIGHKAQTNQFENKIKTINTFLLNKNVDEAYSFLKKNNITYVYLGGNDSILTYGFKPEKKPYLIKVYDEGQAKIYKVR